jgi:hypothetical protein
MEKYYLILILILLCILFYIYQLFTKSIALVENFEDKYNPNEKYEDIYDKEFVDFYDIIYNEPSYHQEILNILNEQIPNKESNILIVGSNTGHLLKNIKKEYKNVQGLDKSELMLKKSHLNYPYIKTNKGDIQKGNLFNRNSFNLILFESKTLNQNNKKVINSILKHCHLYLKKNGLLMIPVYDNNKLNPRPKYYTTNYLDKKNNIHGFTYLNDFSHDAYYIKNLDENKDDVFNYDYFDKIVLKTNQHRIKKTPLFIPSKEEYYDKIVESGFEIKKIYELDNVNVSIEYEMAVFKKMNTEMDINELENKK